MCVYTHVYSVCTCTYITVWVRALVCMYTYAVRRKPLALSPGRAWKRHYGSNKCT